MKILVINCGSSSLKYQLFNMQTSEVLAKGICERIGIEGGIFKHTVPSKEDFKLDVTMKNHGEAIKLVVDALVDKEHGVISSMTEVAAVGHRVLHGGEKFSGSMLIDDAVIAAVEECCELGPLHNPHNLTGIRACEEIMGDVPQVAVFDTSFHQTMPDFTYMYALPYEYYEKYKFRRYGFHGTSHRYVSARAAKMLGRPIEEMKIVTCHLGNGSSICAVKNGKSYDTTMGLTPLEGIMMGTRCGSIDPAIVPLLMEKENLTTKEIDSIMNKKSGILGIYEKSSDNRDIEAAVAAGDKRAILVENMFCHQLTKYVGAFAAAMGGVDAVVFTGGIGENSAKYRACVVENIKFMGAAIDPEKNKVRGVEIDISTEDAKIRTLIIPTNEELTIALDTQEIFEGLKK